MRIVDSENVFDAAAKLIGLPLPLTLSCSGSGVVSTTPIQELRPPRPRGGPKFLATTSSRDTLRSQLCQVGAPTDDLYGRPYSVSIGGAWETLIRTLLSLGETSSRGAGCAFPDGSEACDDCEIAAELDLAVSSVGGVGDPVEVRELDLVLPARLTWPGSYYKQDGNGTHHHDYQ